MSQIDKESLRQLLIVLSSIRAQDNERYNEHVEFTKEIVQYIKTIHSDQEKLLEKIMDSVKQLNETVNNSINGLNSLNPIGLKDSSEKLDKIINEINKNMMTMNVENLFTEMKGLIEVEKLTKSNNEVIELTLKKKQKETHVLKPSDLFNQSG